MEIGDAHRVGQQEVEDGAGQRIPERIGGVGWCARRESERNQPEERKRAASRVLAPREPTAPPP